MTMQEVRTKPIELDDGYMLVNTEMLMQMLADGKQVFLPELAEMPDGVTGYSDEDMETYRQAMNVSEIESVVRDGEEEVQCIEVADDQHLYLTDEFITCHNTSNIVFLKSTDDSMLDTLTKMSGTRHVAYRESKNITQNLEKIALKNEGAISYTVAVKEEPVISYNNLAYIQERNSIVFRAGDSPIWNRNETILPMSWRLFMNKIVHPGKDYSLQTNPTLSNVLDFDLRKNQPDFLKMVEKRLNQAVVADDAKEMHREAFGYSDYEVSQLDPDVYSDDVMEIIDAMVNAEKAERKGKENADKDAAGEDAKKDASTSGKGGAEGDSDGDDDFASSGDELIDYYDNDDMDYYDFMSGVMANDEVTNEVAKNEKEMAALEVKKFASNLIAPEDLYGKGGANHSLDTVIVDSYLDVGRGRFARDASFTVKGSDLYSSDGTPYIVSGSSAQELKRLQEMSGEPNARVFSEESKDVEAVSQRSYVVTDEFLKHLAHLDSWSGLVGGMFERSMTLHMRKYLAR